jgi:hypothetical protein
MYYLIRVMIKLFPLDADLIFKHALFKSAYGNFENGQSAETNALNTMLKIIPIGMNMHLHFLVDSYIRELENNLNSLIKL